MSDLPISNSARWLLDLPEDEVLEVLTPDLRELAEIIGLKATVALLEHFAGQQLYICRTDGHGFRRLRRRRIVEEFNGSNHASLAVKYGTTVRTVHRILADEPSKDSGKQRSLFD